MSWIIKFVLTCLVVIALGLLLLLSNPSGFNLSSNAVSQYFHTQASVENTIPAEVLAVDHESSDAKQIVKRLHSGDAEFLLWNDMKTAKGTIYLLNSAQSLVQLSHNRSGHLDLFDTNFNHLMVAKFDYRNKILYYTPIKEAGIAAITIAPNYLAEELLSDPRRYDEIVGKVVYSDSSNGILRAVILPADDLKQVRLQPMFKSN